MPFENFNRLPVNGSRFAGVKRHLAKRHRGRSQPDQHFGDVCFRDPWNLHPTVVAEDRLDRSLTALAAERAESSAELEARWQECPGYVSMEE